SEDDFLRPEGAFRGLGPERMVLAERGGRLLGLVAAWDQHAYRQSVVEGYGGWVAWLRSLYNGWQWLRGQPGLPPPGAPLPTLAVALPLVVEADPALFTALLDDLRRRWAGGPWSHLLLGLHERDPLLPVA